VTYTGQFWGLWTWGNETRDTVHVSDLELHNQTFESVTYWWPNPYERDDLYDTVLGLALRDMEIDNTTLRSPSLFQAMLEEKVLDDPLFTLRLSRRDEEIGELTLGGIPDYIDKHNLVEIPLTQNYDGGDSMTMRFYSSNG
jgi:saccharopepsin